LEGDHRYIIGQEIQEGERNQLIVEDLLEKFPKDNGDLERLREIVKR